MENHPIPQNITGFEFKLIGDMTLKQFAFLAGGAVIAWIFYILPGPLILKFPFIALFAGAGAAFAFIPVDGRPLDVMLKNLLHAIFSPTQYVYQKAGGELLSKDEQKLKDFNEKRLSIADMNEKQLKDFLKNLPKSTSKADKKEMVFFQNLSQYTKVASPQVVPSFVPEHAFADKSFAGQPSQPQPQKAQGMQDNIPNEDLQKTAELLSRELAQAKAIEAARGTQVNSKDYLEAHGKVLELQKSLNDLLVQKQQLENRLMELQKQVQSQGKTIYSPSVAKEETRQTQFVRSVPSNMTKSVGLPSTPEFPNIVTGILKDPRGNPLQNVLVEVKDAQGNAVRAFKTNALGHFASATPLINGNYTIDFEDPKAQNRFDSVGFLAKGEIILPIEVISVDTREELRRTLFN